MHTTLASDLAAYANSFARGYLKHHKAVGMVEELRTSPAIMEDEVRFLSYLDGALSMEGFLRRDIELIMGWLYERRLLLSD